MQVDFGRKKEESIEIPAMNRVFIAGVISTRPQLKFTYSHKKVNVFKVCVPKRKLSDLQEYYEESPVDHIEVVLSGDEAEKANHCMIGSMVMVEGSLFVHPYYKPDTRNNGVEIYVIGWKLEVLKQYPTKKMDAFLHDEAVRRQLYISDNEIRIMTVNDRGEAEVTPTDIDLSDVPM